MKILIVYDSKLGSVKQMARLIARGIESIPGAEAVIRCVPDVSIGFEGQKDSMSPDSGDLQANIEDLMDIDGLVIGSPTRFGNMSASMKYFLDGTTPLWMTGELSGKPAAVFTSSSSMHGGQESTLLSMLNPLLHHGMLICGLPYSEPALSKTISGGTPYGASHVAGSNNTNPITEDEKSLCLALGKRISLFAKKLRN